MPDVSGVVLLCIIAARAIMNGVTELVTAIQMRKVIAGEWMLVIDGIVSIAFGCLPRRVSRRRRACLDAGDRRVCRHGRHSAQCTRAAIAELEVRRMASTVRHWRPNGAPRY